MDVCLEQWNQTNILQQSTVLLAEILGNVQVLFLAVRRLLQLHKANWTAVPTKADPGVLGTCAEPCHLPASTRAGASCSLSQDSSWSSLVLALHKLNICWNYWKLFWCRSRLTLQKVGLECRNRCMYLHAHFHHPGPKPDHSLALLLYHVSSVSSFSWQPHYLEICDHTKS